MLLTVDIGNTNITLGIFDNDKFIEEFRLASDKDLSQERYEVLLNSLCKDYKITKCVMGSVVEELNNKITRALENTFNVSVLSINHEIETGIKINLKLLVPTELQTQLEHINNTKHQLLLLILGLQPHLI